MIPLCETLPRPLTERESHWLQKNNMSLCCFRDEDCWKTNKAKHYYIVHDFHYIGGNVLYARNTLQELLDLLKSITAYE